MSKWWMLAVMLGVIAAGCSQPTATTPPQPTAPREEPAATAEAPDADQQAGKWQEEFPIDKAALRNTGHNTYFSLEPGHQVTMEGREGSQAVKLVITVLNETELVDGVVTRVIEEREWKGGKLKEVSRNFYAIDPATGNVYYFGEDVDNYGADGRVRDHHSAWRSGVNGARFGMMMPGRAEVGQKYYQEQAEADEAMDRAEHISVTETMETAAGRFTNCLKSEETSPLEPGHPSIKMYIPEVGMAQDGALEIVSFKK